MKNINSENLINESYNRSKLADTWSEENYNKYEFSNWNFHDYPLFNGRQTFDNLNQKIDGSILEIGSAMGGAYRYLYHNKTLDKNSDYTGMDISKKGIDFCKKKFQEANWIQSDLTKHTFTKKYDYVFERIAVHHMETPLKVFSKLLEVTNKSFSCQFVSCLKGKTISDLKIARYRHEAGQLVFFNIINLFEVIEIAIEKGFNKINIIYHGAHEKVGHNPVTHQYLSPDINIKKRMFGRCTLNISKLNQDKIEIALLNKRSKNDRTLKLKKLLFMADNSHRNYINYVIKRMTNRGDFGGILFSTNLKGENYA
ncbi:hypothetical protein DEJ39_02095 [Bacteroidetes bacterium SCGC AAA795-G10]|nr:hypothetical protein DEJ39_02095 [Bacteroidetes bacterium SCGC AAA795-G10]